MKKRKKSCFAKRRHKHRHLFKLHLETKAIFPYNNSGDSQRHGARVAPAKRNPKWKTRCEGSTGKKKSQRKMLGASQAFLIYGQRL